MMTDTLRGEIWTVHATDDDGILRMVLVQERFRAVTDWESGDIGEVVYVLPVRDVTIDEDWWGPPSLRIGQWPGTVAVLDDGRLEVAVEWQWAIPASMLRRRVYIARDYERTDCPNPECENGFLKGTNGVGCALCQPSRQQVGWMGLRPGEEP